MKRTLRTLLYTAALVVAIVVLVRLFVMEPYRVPSGQMENTLLSGDRLWVNKWSLRWGNHTPTYQDILLYKLPEMAQPQSYRHEIAIARCLGLPGDSIRSTGNDLYINGKKVLQTPLITEAYLSPDSLSDRINNLLTQHHVEWVEQGKIKGNRLLLLSRNDYSKVSKSVTPDSLLYPVFLHRDNYEITLPRKGEPLLVTPQNAPLLHTLLTRYEHRRVELRDSLLYEGGKRLKICIVRQNYYWVVGDNRAALNDSRTFGPLPHSLLVGKGMGIGFSQDPDKPFWQSFRTHRFFNTQL